MAVFVMLESIVLMKLPPLVATTTTTSKEQHKELNLSRDSTRDKDLNLSRDSTRNKELNLSRDSTRNKDLLTCHGYCFVGHYVLLLSQHHELRTRHLGDEEFLLKYKWNTSK